jgi:hypothetical protein
MVPSPFGREVVRKYWLLHEIMRGLALRRIQDVQFAGGNLHRQHVTWDNGANIWVNRGESDWQVEDHLLPQYGFLARVPVQGGIVEAGIARRDGIIVEWSHSPQTIYSSARPVVLEQDSESGRLSGGPDLRPTRMNPQGKTMSFGSVSTNGAVRLTRQDGKLLVTPLPDSPYFALSIDWKALPWNMVEPKRLEALDEDDRILWSTPVSLSSGRVQFTCEPGIFAYRLD